MDMLAFLQDSTDDDDSDSDKVLISETAKVKKTTLSSSACATACRTGHRRSKMRRRGCIDVISSSKARDSEIFSRSVPHRRGHWAGHVKIPVLTANPLFHDAYSLRRRKKNIVNTFRDLLEKRGISGTIVEHECLHISMSKQFSLQVAQIESFVQQITNLVQQEHATSLHIDSMSASELRTIWDNGSMNEILLLNEEKTRSFLCWKVLPNVTLKRLVAHIDTVMKSYKQPLYYTPAKFHVSIASFPGNLLERLDTLENDVASNNVQAIEKSEIDGQSQSPTTSERAYDSSVRRRIVKCVDADDSAEEEEDSSSSSSESANSSCCLVPVRELKCTVGTTKEYKIPLRCI